MTFFYGMKIKMDRFMTGRYGSDALNRMLLLLWVLFLIVAFIVATPWLYLPQLILCTVIFYRMLSRNIVRRRKENAAYYDFMRGLGMRWRHMMIRLRDRKTVNFFRCPHCKTEIRMPKKQGRFNIRCPKCEKEFTKEFR